MTMLEAVRYSDLGCRCRHQAFRQLVLSYAANENKSEPLAEEIIALSRKYRSDHEFRLAVRKVAKKFEDRPVEPTKPTA